MPVRAFPAEPGDPDSLALERIRPWLHTVAGPDGCEHAVLSDGLRHIRLDVTAGRFESELAVRLHYDLTGIQTAHRRLLPLRRLLHLYRHHRFAHSLFPQDPLVARGIEALRVHDAIQAGASQREIASVLFGQARIDADWAGPSDALRSRVKRLIHQARRLASGAYRQLLREDRPASKR